MRVLPSYVTISDLPKYKDLDTESVQTLKDKGLDAYVNKTVFKQQSYELPKADKNITYNYIKTYSDATSYYDVIGVEGWTVGQFKDWVLQHDWNGRIELWGDEPFDGKPDYIRFQILYAYDKDKLVDVEDYVSKELIEPNPKKYLERRIKDASVIDGWNNQKDFHISLEPTNNYEFSF